MSSKKQTKVLTKKESKKMKDSVFQKRFQRKQQNRQVHGQQLTVFYLDVRQFYSVDSEAAKELERSKNQVSKALYEQIEQSLIGFSSEMQMDIVDCIRDCVDGIAIQVTGIKHVDRILWPLYHKIQRELANRVNNNIIKVNR